MDKVKVIDETVSKELSEEDEEKKTGDEDNQEDESRATEVDDEDEKKEDVSEEADIDKDNEDADEQNNEETKVKEDNNEEEEKTEEGQEDEAERPEEENDAEVEETEETTTHDETHELTEEDAENNAAEDLEDTDERTEEESKEETDENTEEQDEKTQELTEEDREKFRQMFDRKAVNNRLDLKGFKVLFRLMGEVISANEAEEMFEEGDTDDDKTIDFEEFCRLYAKFRQEEQQRKEAILESFDKLFPGNDGESVELKKVEQLLMKLQQPDLDTRLVREKSDLGEDDIKYLVRSMDADGSGFISKQEFVNMLCQHIDI